MSKRQGGQVDPLRRINREIPATGSVAGFSEMRADHILGGASIPTDARERIRVARYAIRFGLDNQDRQELLDIFDVTWDDANPGPIADRPHPATTERAS